MLITDVTPRHCSRCRLPLTDPASREAGQGPVCRNKDNHLYAKTIKANLPAASAIVLGTHGSELPPEVRDRWETFKAAFLRQMQRADLASDLMFTGADFRDCVRDVDFIMSYHMSASLQHRMVEIVRHLGYPGLAGVLAGEACVSTAKVWFENGKLYLDGRACTTGFHAMRRIPGVVTPRYRGERVPYSAPAGQHAAFLDNVRRFWPLYEGDLDSIRDSALEYLNTRPTSVGTSTAISTDASIRMRSEDFVLSFSWVRGAPMYDLINKIKSDIPSSGRSYDPASKTWSCKKQYVSVAKEALGLIFSEDQIGLVETNEETPAGLYQGRRSAPAGGARRSYYSKGNRRWMSRY